MLSILFVSCVMQNIFEQQVSAQKIGFSSPEDVTNNIFLYYFKGPTFNDQIILKLEDGLNLIKQANFDVHSPTIFFYHGWDESAISGSAQEVVSAFIEKHIRNVVAFDYSALVRYDSNLDSYVISVQNASVIGQAIGEFFKKYIPTKQPPNLVKLVSHSLGSQIMAKTARVYGVGKLERLTGLDPAGPLYTIPGIHHLDATDGKFVDIIHTDGGFFGDGRTTGTVDFFPNNGTRVQPGCDDGALNPLSFCSHHRSFKFYAESIRNPNAFLAKKCKRILDFTECCCDASTVTYMGYNIHTSVKGTYYLQTNAQSPFGKGQNGINSF